jgi:hypothetical protein
MFEITALYAKSASKNKQVGQLFSAAIAELALELSRSAKTMEKSHPDELFNIVCDISHFKNASRNFFTGSVISDTLDGVHNGQLLVNLGKSLVASFASKLEETASAIWE